MSDAHEPSASAVQKIGRVSALILLAFAIIYGVGGSMIEYAFSSDPLGPRVFPVALAVALALLSLLHFRSPGSAEGFPTGPLLWRLLSVPALMVISALLFEPAGFAISIFVLTLGGGVIFGASWKMAAVGAVAHAALWWFIFSYLLEVYLPAGLLG